MIYFPEPDGIEGFLIKQPVPMYKSLNISSVLVANIKAQSMHLSLPLRYKNMDREQIIETQILLDSRAEGPSWTEPLLKKTIFPQFPSWSQSSHEMLMELPTNQEGLPIVPGPISSSTINNSWQDSSSWTPEKVMSF